MASPVKVVSTATATQVTVAAKKKPITRDELNRIEQVVRSCRFLGVESLAVCMTLSRQSCSIVSGLIIGNQALRLSYAKGFFRLLWVDYFNQAPTDIEVVMSTAAYAMLVRTPVPKTASFDQLIEMKGSLGFFYETPLAPAEIPYEVGEFACRYKLFREFSDCLTNLVVNDYQDEQFFGFLQTLIQESKGNRFLMIDKVFSRMNELHPPKKISDEHQASPIPGTSAFVPVKAAESCCVIL